MNKKAGILMPVSSLPARYGVGDFGPEAYRFIDLVAQMRMKIWQVLPLNPLGYGNSPYQAYSSFAGDEIYISLDKLINDGLLQPADLNPDCRSYQDSRVEFQVVRSVKSSCLQQAFANFNTAAHLHSEYANFVACTPWLTNYAVFLTLKKNNGMQLWTKWPKEHKEWIKNPEVKKLTAFQQQISYEMFVQFIFFRQWRQLKAYANSLGIAILGDIPMYSGMDSLDVWENQEFFLLDAEQNPTHVAGAPPDFFSATGQRWGNPLYNWDVLAADGFNFWIQRLRISAEAFDVIRIDHFRAFDTYWKIPSSCETAIEGEWVAAPGYALFDRIYRELPEIKIVAEDLGDLRPEVLELRDHYKLKGMKVFQFIFDPLSDNCELKNSQNCILYTGTHDNNTLMGWYAALDLNKQQAVKHFFKVSPEDLKNAILNYLLNTQAEIVIFPLQDILGLTDEARLNFPGKIGSPNWEWRLIDFKALEQHITRLAGWIVSSGRAS